MEIVSLLLKRPYVGMFPIQSVLKKGCRNLSLKSVFSRYTANRNFPTPLELFQQHPPYSFLKILHC